MQAKKSLGQNFLIDDNILNKIKSALDVKENDLIIEIGPGRGSLTKKLQEYNCFLVCYEIDHDLDEYLKPITNNKTRIIYQDILQSDLKNILKDYNYHNLYIVGNLPYYITTPIIKYLINLDLDVKEMLFMVQEEVADRFTAKSKSKDYGSMTLYLKYYYHVEKLFKVSKTSFLPVPKVESAIIKLTKRIDRPDVDVHKYLQLINDSFKMKRKTLKNNLSNYDYDKIKEVLKEYNLNDNVRAEELEEEVFIKIVKDVL